MERWWGKLNDFQQIKTGLGMTEISQETIDHIPCIKAFNDVKMDNLLYKYHKSLLTLAKNKNSSKEVGLFWDLNNVDKEPLRIIGKANGFNISSSYEINRLVKNPYSLLTVVVMHNHPRNGMFSGADIKSFTDFDSIYLMTAVCNDGTIYMIRKERNFNPFAMQKYYEEGAALSHRKAQNEIMRKVKKLKLDTNDANDRKKIAKMSTKSYYYGIKNVAKHAKEIGITYRCSVKRK